MRTFRGSGGPFLERPHYSDLEIDQICEEALQQVGLLPNAPEPVRIDRFIEKRFGVSPIYEELPAGVLGYTTFSEKGVRSVHIARFLLDEGTTASNRRLNSTLAHEAGHGLLHAHLFALQDAGLSMFGTDPDFSSTQVLCRDGDQQGRSGYDGRWWELQANKAIGSLLLPRSALSKALGSLLSRPEGGRRLTIAAVDREDAARALSVAFEVNPAVSRIRLNSLYPLDD